MGTEIPDIQIAWATWWASEKDATHNIVSFVQHRFIPSNNMHFRKHSHACWTSQTYMPNLHLTWLSVIQLQENNETQRTNDDCNDMIAIKNISKVKGHSPPGSGGTVVSSHQGEGGHEQRNPPCHQMIRSEKHMQMLGTLYLYVYTTKRVYLCV